jgi:hypothetical protein
MILVLHSCAVYIRIDINRGILLIHLAKWPPPPPSVAVQSLKDFGRLTYRRCLELLRHMVGLLGRVIGSSQGLYLHRTTQHRKTRTNIHALSGIRTHDPSNQPVKTRASDRTATVTGHCDRQMKLRNSYLIEDFWVYEYIMLIPVSKPQTEHWTETKGKQGNNEKSYLCRPISKILQLIWMILDFVSSLCGASVVRMPNFTVLEGSPVIK